MTSGSVERQLIEAVLRQRVDEPAFEHCRLLESGETYHPEGCVLAALDGTPAEVRYAVTCGREMGDAHHAGHAHQGRVGARDRASAR